LTHQREKSGVWRELAQLRESHAECMRVGSPFPASMPHTLRTPHTNLKTHTQLAKPLNSSAK